MLRRQFGWVGLLLSWLFLTPLARGADDPNQLLALARDKNQMAIASILTMECRYERLPWAGTTREQAKKYRSIPAAPGQFWRCGDSYRLFEPYEEDRMTRDYVVRNGQSFSRVVDQSSKQRRPIVTLDTVHPT